jgi:rRNA-processing protein FCF1
MTIRSPKSSKNIKVILDSNAFFVPIQFRIDISEEIQRLLNARPRLILLSAVQKELEKLGESDSPKMRKSVALALKLAEKCVLFKTREKTGLSVDDIIVDVACRWKSPVLTNDRQLRRRLRDINVPVIYVRQKSHLAIEGMIQPV